MRIARAELRNFGRATLGWLLDHDSQLIGLVLLAIAADSWISLFRRYDDLLAYLAQGIYAVPSLSLVTMAFSALYLTAVSAILLTSRQPLARYETLVPNLVSLVAAFGVYCFSLLPPPDVPLMGSYLPLSLLALGTTLILFSLIYLRRAFSVTPHARHLVHAGPYAIVRHPMYLGNIISLLGIALLIGTVAAMLLFVVAGALQVVRALLEERLLERTFPDYAEYKRQVGGFVPIVRLHKVHRTLVLAAACLCLGSGLSLAQQPAGNAEDTCRAWHNKALSGTWFSPKEAEDFAGTESRQEALVKHPACRAFFALQTKCQGYALSLVVNEIKEEVFLNRVDATAGCKPIVGFATICDALRSLSRKRARLTEVRKTMLSECLDQSMVTRRADFMRPAL